MTQKKKMIAQDWTIKYQENSSYVLERCAGINDFLADMTDQFDFTPSAAVAEAAPLQDARIAAAAFAVADLYVSATGRDSNPGTYEQPLATITRAVALSDPGDVVSVRGGTYKAIANIWKGGTKDNPLTIQAQAGETVILDGKGLASNKDLVSITASYVTFDGFEVRNATRSGISVYAAHDVTISNNEVENSKRNGIWIGGGREGQSYNQVVENNVVHDNVLENSARNWSDGWARGIAIDVTTNSIIRDNMVYDNYGEGLGGLSSSRLSFVGNTAHDNYSVQMYFDNSQYITARDNLVFHTGDRDYYRSGKPGTGMLIANEYTEFQKRSIGYVVTDNTLAGVGAPKYDGSYGWGGGLSSSTIAPNEILSAAAVQSDWTYLG
jgi:parallel beta-helix repeat protein